MIQNIQADKNETEARERLLTAAIEQFAAKGFEGATTRDICQQADVNISAIRYYFGDKTGLYRAVFREPCQKHPHFENPQKYSHLPIETALDTFFFDFLLPFKQQDQLDLMMKLRLREMIKPTGVWQHEIQEVIKPQHQVMAQLFQNYLGLQEIDLDIERLTFAIIGMAVHLFLGYQVVCEIAPQMLNSESAVDIQAKRLSMFALAMLESEASRRKQETNK